MNSDLSHQLCLVHTACIGHLLTTGLITAGFKKHEPAGRLVNRFHTEPVGGGRQRYVSVRLRIDSKAPFEIVLSWSFRLKHCKQHMTRMKVLVQQSRCLKYHSLRYYLEILHGEM